MSDNKPISLYIHIPFCVKKCLYCDFLSFPGTPHKMEEYCGCLIKEIEAARDYIGLHGFYVNTVFIGGGTPSIISEDLIDRILCKLKPCFPSFVDAPEITIEVNPGTLKGEKGRDKALSYVRSGINRVSIGLQSADDAVLRRIGRIHDYSDFLETFDLVKNAGITNVNVDIMQDLPDTGYETCIDTLEKVIALSPKHISAYSLILEEGTPLYEKRREFSFPDEEEDRRIYRDSKEILERNGFCRYEISNYAVPGYECVHNLVYWERGDYLGLGLGASSCVGDVRWKNPSGIKAYSEYVDCISGEYCCNTLGMNRLPMSLFPCRKFCEEYEILSENDIISETMFLGLRMSCGIDLSRFAERFGRDVRSVYGGKVDEFISLGILREEHGRLRLTDHGIDVSNSVFSELLL